MKAKRPLYIFHIEHPSGSPIILHPFQTDQDVIERLPHAEVQGLYGHDPRVETITLIRTILYKRIESSVQSWLKEKRFLKKFLISSGVFLFVYLGLTVGMRDPIPMVDELLAATAASVGLYYYLAKRDQNSEPAVRKRVQLRGKVDSVRFSHHPGISRIESYLKDHPSMTKEEVLEYIAGELANNNEGIEDAAEQALRDYAKKILGSKKLKKQELE